MEGRSVYRGYLYRWVHGGFYYCLPPIKLVGGCGVWRLTVVRVMIVIMV